ncbi:hypothetical protein [Polynucleobacter asymbioticus]|uniref:MASE1 domain-containing protein n=1 Tax=Polynucleobacter asymbioticus (strain DSM 18221 / CIP 109841 / QLW-P1DMWA-1) TaxID=312153 RepID=A4SV51_POLAQ|nr:hypothetical protein [Polynucleobacter asymbioticus]ABP33365.1 conserved hypothetical protein [Polynucleobacter asymbioticus QLW-P1DMWA-1]APC05168.1 hypothetical protein AOC10_00785 [Polynucleobacter asymbioticus]
MPKISFLPSEWFVGIVVSALSYATLFYINSWLTGSLIYSLGVNWIYLPAGLRLFITLIFGLPGAIGIALATFTISYFGALPQDLTLCIGTGLISGFAPYLARVLILSNTQLAPDLSNLNLPKLVICILLYALLSAGLHQFWYATMALDGAGTPNHFLVMFIGDVFGSLLLISVIKYGLDLLRHFKQRAR